MNYQRTQIFYKEYLFDSIQECNYFKILEERINKKEISDLKVHPTFVLQPPFDYFGKKINGIEYTPDFSYIEKNQKVCVEIKGIPTPDFELRLKIWKYLNQNILIKVLCYSNSTGWLELHDYKKARKIIKKEMYIERISKEIEKRRLNEEKKLAKLSERRKQLLAKEKLTKTEQMRLGSIENIMKGK
jgi:hypothetical protein